MTTLKTAPHRLTPCVQVCVIEPVSGLCEGCGRTLGEISDWPAMPPHEREALMAALPARLAKLRKDR